MCIGHIPVCRSCCFEFPHWGKRRICRLLGITRDVIIQASLWEKRRKPLILTAAKCSLTADFDIHRLILQQLKMASPTMEYVTNVFRYLPQGHDDALKQAFYNTAAMLFVIIACGAGLSVYYILEAFLRPLLWAVLCGTFLYPFKNTLTVLVCGWLKNLRNSGTPLALGTVLVPINVLNTTAETLGSSLLQHLKIIVIASAALPTIYILYHFGPLCQILQWFPAIFNFVYDALGYFSAMWVSCSAMSSKYIFILSMLYHIEGVYILYIVHIYI